MTAKIDTQGLYKMTFYGILNSAGGFWTPIAFDSEQRAEQYLKSYWPNHSIRSHNFKIVPVRIRLDELPAQGIEASHGGDPEEGRHAKHESPVPKGCAPSPDADALRTDGADGQGEG